MHTSEEVGEINAPGPLRAGTRPAPTTSGEQVTLIGKALKEPPLNSKGVGVVNAPWHLVNITFFIIITGGHKTRPYDFGGVSYSDKESLERATSQ